MLEEKTICKFQEGKNKLHLIEITYKNAGLDYNTQGEPMCYDEYKYQVRLNRKRIKTSKFEYEMRKLFAVMTQNMVLQLKIY